MESLISHYREVTFFVLWVIFVALHCNISVSLLLLIPVLICYSLLPVQLTLYLYQRHHLSALKIKAPLNFIVICVRCMVRCNGLAICDWRQNSKRICRLTNSH